MSYYRLEACNDVVRYLELPPSNYHTSADVLHTTILIYATNVLAVALSYLHVGGRTPTDL